MAPIETLSDLGERAVRENQAELKLSLLRPCGTSEAELQSFCEWFSKDTILTELHFRSNQLGDKGMADLAKVLKDNNTLEKLYLSGNDLGDESALQLAEVLEVNSTLQQLYLNVNRFGDVGAKHLADALVTNSNLQVLYLNNSGIQDDGAKEFARALKKNGVLEVLSLNGNNIQDFVSLQKIAELLKRNKAGLGPAPGEVVDTSEEEEEEDEEEDEDALREGEESEDAHLEDKDNSDNELKDQDGSENQDIVVLDEDQDSVEMEGDTSGAQAEGSDTTTKEEQNESGPADASKSQQDKASQDLKQIRELQREKFEAARSMPAEVKDEKQMLMAMFEQLEQAQKDPPSTRIVVPEQGPIPPEEDLPLPSKSRPEGDLPPPIGRPPLDDLQDLPP